MQNGAANPAPLDFDIVFEMVDHAEDVIAELNALDLEVELGAAELEEINELRRLSVEISSPSQPLYTCT